jgi:hypothetical protein
LLRLLAARILAGYLKRKAQRRADKEDFAGLLHDEVTQTFETEKVKEQLLTPTRGTRLLSEVASANACISR